jgi:hypothetical protein
MPSASHRIGGHVTLLWLAPHHSRARPPSSLLACSAAKLRAYGEALGFVLALVEAGDALGGLIGLRHDLWNRCDLPQRALAEWAYSKEAINNRAPRLSPARCARPPDPDDADLDAQAAAQTGS